MEGFSSVALSFFHDPKVPVHKKLEGEALSSATESVYLFVSLTSGVENLPLDTSRQGSIA